jgi:alpha-tubulin suppressor-like RCC1 family protein
LGTTQDSGDTAANKDGQTQAKSNHRKPLLLALWIISLLGVLAALNAGSFVKKPGNTLDVGRSNREALTIEPGQQTFAGSDIEDIKQGDQITMVLTKNGRVYAQGTNTYGEQALGKFGGENVFLRAVDFGKDVKITQIDTSNKHVVALDSDGNVWTWGRNLSGQLGNNTRADSNKPIRVFSGVRDIAAGYRFSAAIKENGELWAWGMYCDPNLPGLSELTESFAADISVGGSYYDGAGPQDSVDCLNEQNLPIKSIKPRRIPAAASFVSVSGGYGHLLMIDKDKKAWGFGCNGWGQLGRGHTQNNSKTRVVTPVAFPGNVRIQALEAGFRHSMALDTDGKVWLWGHSEKGEVMTYGSNRSDAPTQVKLDGRATWVMAGRDISGAIIGNGLYMLGNNEVAQISVADFDKEMYTVKSFKKIADSINAASLGYTTALYWKK